MDEPITVSGRSEFVPPIVLAIAFTLLGEMLILVVWGLQLFPAGPFWPKLAWTFICGVAMGATIGALVNVFVTARLTGRNAAIASGVIYFAVLAVCTVLCFQIDQSIGGLFGATEAPWLFLLGGLIPAFATSVVYVWLLYSPRGRRLLGVSGT